MGAGSQQSAIPAALTEGFTLHRSGDLKGALRCYRRVLKRDKNNIEALYLLGSLHSQMGDHKRAETGLRSALNLQPSHVEARYNLARLFMDTNRFDDAEIELNHLLSVQPDHLSAARNMGVVCLKLGNPKGALQHLNRAITIDPTSPETWCDLGLALSQTGDDPGAEQAFTQALALDSSMARARHNRGHIRLRNLNFAEGWQDYEARKQDPKSGYVARSLGVPEWEGQDLSGKTVLVCGEQGLGDQILHASALRDLIGRAKKVLLESDGRLASLFARSFPDVYSISACAADEIEIAKTPLDFQISSGSIGQWFWVGRESISKPSPYLSADPKKVEEFIHKYREVYGDRPLIGVSWCSHRVGLGAHKSTNLVEHWGPIFAAQPNAVFVSLQYGTPSEIEQSIAALKKGHPTLQFVCDSDVDTNNDIEGLAAQIAALDLVVSVSNTTVHLAGALGVPVWTLVPRGPSRLWYWLDGRTESIWYPSMKLAWQLEIGVWDAAVNTVATALKGWQPNE